MLDYVAAWYLKAAEYVRGTMIPAAFVSTNSITQGEQVGVLWGELYRRGMRIRFGHRTFTWQSEARGKAHVHVVIIGFGPAEAGEKKIFDYDVDPDHPIVTSAKNISPYLCEGPDTVVMNRSTPICFGVPEMVSGNQPLDNGNYFFTPEEKASFIRLEPQSEPYFRQWYGGEEFINGIERWCLWLGEVNPTELRNMPLALTRVEAVKNFRLASKRMATLRVYPGSFA